MERKLSEKILTIGNRSDKPDGGIAQVLYSYRKHVFPVFKSVVNFKRGNFFYKMLVTGAGYIDTFFCLLFDRKIRIVHIHTASGNGFRRNIPFVSLATMMGKEVVLHIHSGRFNDYYEDHRVLVEKVFAKCTVIVALTKEIKAFYDKMGCKKVEIINNIIEYPEIRSITFEDEAIHMLYLGVITKTKGIYDLLDVMVEHKKEFEGKLVLHVGGNKEVDTLRTIIADNHLEGIVKFEGWVSGENKIDLLNKCQVFVLPSYTEGLPISILEALSYGDFIIATNVGGIPEIVNSDNGILFPPADKHALHEALKKILETRPFNENRQKIIDSSKNYLPDVVGEQLERLYLNILK